MKPRLFSPWKTAFQAAVVLGLFGWGYMLRPDRDQAAAGQGATPLFRSRGYTMGTSYEVKAPGLERDAAATVALRNRIEQLLADINRQMSTYDPESEISLFNQHASHSPFPVSPAFGKVVGHALRVAERTQGAFDPTLDPLINLWGFGHRHHPENAGGPDAERFSAARALCGYQQLSIADGNLTKGVEGLQLNLGAIAKGYAVDCVFELLAEQGAENIYVEIGGELRVCGNNPDGHTWRLGIQVPDPGAGVAALRTLDLDDRSLATSGDYRNFRTDAQGAQVAQHILDPRSGRPPEHQAVSVSVITATCMEADALATALFVMGADEGLPWIEARAGREAIFIERSPTDGDFRIRASSGFPIP